MRPMTISSRGLGLGLALTLALLSPLATSAQSQLDAAQAEVHGRALVHEADVALLGAQPRNLTSANEDLPRVAGVQSRHQLD